MQYIYADVSHKQDVYNLLCELEQANFKKEIFDNIYNQNLTNPNIHYILAVDEGNVVGFGSLHIQYLLHHVSKVGEIQELIVNTEYQRQGYGQGIFNKLQEIAVMNKCTLLEVCCNQKRTKSHTFYLKKKMKNSHFKFTYPLI